MSKKKFHRVSVYLLNPERKRILLGKPNQGPYSGQYVAPNAPLNDHETPLDTAEKILGRIAPNGYEFLGHASAMPVVLDERTIRIFPPFQVQLTVVDDQKDFVDYVYLAKANVERPFKDGDVFGWFGRGDMNTEPGHVFQTVLHILELAEKNS